MANQIKINIPSVVGNVTIIAFAEMITSGEEILYMTDSNGNILLDSLSNYLMYDIRENVDTSNYVIDKEGYYVVDEERYQILYYPSKEEEEGIILYMIDLKGDELLDLNGNKLLYNNRK